MSLSLNHDENLYKNQCNEACFVKSSCITKINQTRDSSYKFTEKLYDTEHRNNASEELLTLTLIKAIFESMIGKIEIATALPSVILDPELSKILTTDEMNVINDILLCDIESCSECLSQSDNATFDLKCKESTAHSRKTSHVKDRFDHTVRKVLKILEKHIVVLRTGDRFKHISVPSALFLCHIRYFLKHVLSKMNLTPEQARNEELHYRKLWRCEKKSIKDVPVFTADIEKQRSDHKKILKNIIEQYKKNMVAVDEINKKYDQDIASITTAYEKKQLVLCKAWKFEGNEIQLALENIIDDIEILKRTNSELERAIREQRSTTESELSAIITKYDKEVGSRCRILEELNEIDETNQMEKHALEEELRGQEELYVALVKKKEQEELERFYERLGKFKQERSAKIIQRWWRAVIFLKKEKKKKKKKAKKKKK